MLRVLCPAIDLSRLFITVCDRKVIFEHHLRLFPSAGVHAAVFLSSLVEFYLAAVPVPLSRFVEHFSSSISLEAVKIISHFKIIKIITVPRGFDHKSSMAVNQSNRASVWKA